MSITLAFDVYGTLIDTQGIALALEPHCGDRAPAFAQAWREKQLEYSFRRGLMKHYVSFAICTGQALDHTCVRFGYRLTTVDREALLDAYQTLPAFQDAVEGLALAREMGFRLFAFSNGTAAAVDALLRHAGLREFFQGVVSVDDLCSFKPDPAVYAHFLRQAGATGGEAWMVSGNPFDVIGAQSAGLRAAWVRRSKEALFDPWGIEPTLTVSHLGELAARIRQTQEH